MVADKDGPDSQFEKEIEDAEIMISTPFHPGYPDQVRPSALDISF